MHRERVYADRALPGRVLRYHTWPMLTTQTVGQHCCRVAQIYVEIFGMPRAEVLYYCLCHDDGELWAGDVPYSGKRGVPGLQELMDKSEELGLEKLGVQMPRLEEHEWRRFKICDLLEMWETGTHEQHMGNQYAESVVSDTSEAVRRMAAESGVLARVNNWIADKR